MEVVISIVSWNTQDLLRRCLVSLRTHVNPARSRVVVIDNASKDGTPDMLRKEFPEVTLVESGGNLGFGKAHNLIRHLTTEPYVLFLNPDTEFLEDTAAKMADILNQHPDIALVGSRMVNLDLSVQPLGFQWHSSPWVEFVNNLVYPCLPSVLSKRLIPSHDPLVDGYVRKIYGGCLLARRSALEKVGWFDERFFMYAEDVDLSRRVEAGGFRSFYLSSTSVIHLCGGASAKAPGRFSTLMQCESVALMSEKYYGSFGRSWYQSVMFFRSLLTIAISSVAKAVCPPSLSSIRTKLTNSQAKHRAILSWATGKASAFIPK